MSQAKARLMRHNDEKEKNHHTIHEFQATNEKIKRIEMDNKNFMSQIETLKTELENKKYNENSNTYYQNFEQTNSFKILSGEIEELTKQLELKNLENIFNEKNFLKNFNKIQQAYKFFIILYFSIKKLHSLSNEKTIKFEKLMKLYEKKISDLGKRKKQLKESLKIKDIRIQDLEKENNELISKVSSNSIFSSMGANYSQTISLQKENSELKTHILLLEVLILSFLNSSKYQIERIESMQRKYEGIGK